MVRTIGRNDGVPEEIFTDEEMLEEIRARRAEQQAAEQALAMGEGVANIAKTAGAA